MIFYLKNGEKYNIEDSVVQAFEDKCHYRLCSHFIERALSETFDKDISVCILKYADVLIEEDELARNFYSKKDVPV